jgi:hypothetical protein
VPILESGVGVVCIEHETITVARPIKVRVINHLFRNIIRSFL